jgi:hypothetical protein
LTKGIIPYTTFTINDVPSDQVENGDTAWFKHFVEVYNSERGEQKNEFYRDEFKADTDKNKHTNDYTYVIDFENAYNAINEKFIERWGGVFVTDFINYVDVGTTPAGGEKLPDKYPGGIHVYWISDTLFGRGTRDVTIEKGVNLKSLTITTDTS